MLDTKTMARLPVEIVRKYTKIITPEPSTPPINTFLRPKLSESRAKNGWLTMATTFPAMLTHNMVAAGMPTDTA
ncbi:hypothetical protein D3C74_497290 [compost metagenome]